MTTRHLSIFLGAFLLAACSTTPTPHAQDKLPDTGRPALHAVSDARLRELMEQMNALMFERFMAEPDIDRERRNYALKIVDAADKLGSTVDGILSRLPALNLKPDEQTTFRALAVKLHEQANTLKIQAEHNRIDIIGQTLDQTTATCSSCHALFRKLGN